MPRVERVSTPTVAQASATQPLASASDVSSGAQAIAGAIAGVGEESQKIVTRMNTTAAEDAMVRFERDKNNLFFNGESGYFNTQGKAAVDNMQSTNDALTKLQQQYAGELESSEARRMFERASSARVTRDQASILQHSAKGQRVFEAATLEATTDNAIENAALYWNNDDELTINRISGKQAILDQSNVLGQDPSITAEKLQTYESTFMSTAIKASLDSGDVARAKSLMDKHEKMLEGPDKVELDKMITAEDDKQYITAQAALIIASGGTLDEKREKWLEETDPVKQKAIRQLVVNDDNIQRKIRDDQTKAAYNSIGLSVLDGGSTTELTAETREELGFNRMKTLTDLENKIAAGQTIITDWTTYSGLLLLPDEELKKVEPTDHFDKLAPAQRSALISAVDSVRNPKAPKSAALTDGVSRATQVSGTLKVLIPRKPASYTEEDHEFVNWFNEEMVRQVAAEESATGKKITPERYSEILSKFRHKVVTEDSYKFLGFIPTFGDEEVGLRDISTEHRNIIIDELESRGMSTDPTNILRFYKLAIDTGDL